MPQLFSSYRLAACILALSSSLLAQVTGGALVGVVTDPSGAVLPKVEVQALNAGTNVVATTRTNDVGYYEFSSLPAGRYTLTAQIAGLPDRPYRGDST